MGTTTMALAGDPKVEAWLDEVHVPWTLEAVDLDSVNEAASLRNQARMGDPLDPETVERYTVDMKAGAEFPPVLARRMSKTAKLVLLGGNHRFAAARAAGRDSVAAYVVVIEDEAVAVRLMYEDNRRHGLPPSRSERLAQAVHLVDCGWSNRDAAACVGIHETQVATARTIAKGSKRAAGLGVGHIYDGLTFDKKARLATLNDPVLAEATKVVAASGMTNPEVTDLVKRLRAAGSDTKALGLVGDAMEEHRATAQARAAKSRGKGRVGGAAASSIATRAVIDLLRLDPAEIAATCATQQAKRDLKARLRQLGPWTLDAMKALG